ncbi:MAG: antitoxin VbhA family protein [Alphaproteobacteria bacterium]|nr:antitoxin VbhA family protein [Alphaproteobacteria bacterium]
MNIEQFNEYLKHVDTSKQEIANNWKTAIGLQAVDGLHVSEFLLDIAKRNIDGEITIDEAIALVDDHYKQKNKDS